MSIHCIDPGKSEGCNPQTGHHKDCPRFNHADPRSIERYPNNNKQKNDKKVSKDTVINVETILSKIKYIFGINQKLNPGINKFSIKNLHKDFFGEILIISKILGSNDITINEIKIGEKIICKSDIPAELLSFNNAINIDFGLVKENEWIDFIINNESSDTISFRALIIGNCEL